MHLKHLAKIFPLVFLFSAGIYFAYLAVTQSGVFGESSPMSSPPPGGGAYFKIWPDYMEVPSGSPTAYYFYAKYYDGAIYHPVPSYWELLKPAAGNFVDYTGTPTYDVKFKAGPNAGTYEQALRATCQDPKCPGQIAYASIKVYSSSPTAYCGNSYCESGEDCSNCASDCGSCPTPPPDYPICGNAVCESGEDCYYCASDCGSCPTPPPSCGNAICESGEDCKVCSSDCGSCPTSYCEGFFMTETESHYTCVKNALGADFDYFNARINGEGCKAESKWFSLRDKAGQACFGARTDISELPPDVSICLKERMGEERYRAIFSGSVQKNTEDMQAFEYCFGKFRDTITYTSAPTLDDKTKACLILAVGESRFNEISSGARPTPEEMEKGRKCFGAQPTLGAPPPSYQIPEEMKSCLLEIFGESRFNEMESGKFTTPPTQAEMEEARACYTTKINPIQKTVLPIPPQIVPILEKHEQLKIDVVKTEFRKTDEGDRQPRIVLSGVALPDTLVDIYIFSDPIVLSTRTDSNGVWTYYLEDPLDPGEHTSYVVTRQEDGTEVRSDLFSFRVAAAAPGEEGSLLVEGATPTVLSDYLLAVAGAVAIALVLVLGLFWVKTKRPAGPPPIAPA